MIIETSREADIGYTMSRHIARFLDSIFKNKPIPEILKHKRAAIKEAGNPPDENTISMAISFLFEGTEKPDMQAAKEIVALVFMPEGQLGEVLLKFHKPR